MAKNKGVASRGFVNNTILESLITGDKYGYEIIKEVEEKSNGKIVLKQPSLYSSLKRFESKGYISSYWQDSEIGGRRHYYVITETGKEYYYNNVAKDPTLKITLPKHKEKNKTIQTNNVDVTDENYNVFDLLENKNNIDDNNDIVLEEVEDYNDVFENDDTNEITPEIKEVIEANNVEENEKEAIKLEEESKEFMEAHKEEFHNNEDSLKEEHPSLFAIYNRENEANSVGIQDNLFNYSEKQNSKDLTTEENVNLEALNNLKKTYSYEENEQNKNSINYNVKPKKEIPLISEKEHEIFSWDDLKKKNIQQKNEIVEPKQVVVDEYGIIKIKNDEEEVKPINKIFENAKPRISNNEIKSACNNTSPLTSSFLQEAQENNDEPFIHKFDELANAKKEDNDIDYKQILGDLYTGEDVSSDNEQFNNQSIDFDGHSINEVEYVKEEPKFYFDNSTDNDGYEQVAMFPSDNTPKYKSYEDNLLNEGIKLKTYKASNLETFNNKDFVFVNKIKFFISLIIGILSIANVTILSAVLKSYKLFTNIDSKFSIGYYTAICTVMLLFGIIFLINPNKRKINEFKLSYYLIFSFLLFISISLLSYAICLISGLTTLNINLYLFRLIAPMAISINFIFAPLLYNLFIRNKKFY